MRYLVKARVKNGKEQSLLRAIDERRLGEGSIAGSEYLHEVEQGRANGVGVAPLGGSLLLRATA